MKVYTALSTVDGAGVKLRRYIGAGYVDYLDPFLLLDEIKSSDPEDYRAGFPDHPHRGFQTLTYVVRGRLLHRDSTGAEGVLKEGWLQWMNAGRGVIHSEMPLGEEGTFWGFQLWLNNPKEKKLSEPFYRSYPAKILREEKGLRIVDLAYPLSEEGFYPLLYLHVELSRGRGFSLPREEGTSTFLALSEGRILVEGEEVEAPRLLLPEGGLKVIAMDDSFFLVGRARPLNEPVARYGPFVMNTFEEIERAVRDYREGLF